MIIRPKHISVRNPQAPGPRSRSALCSRRRRYDARIPPIFADHLRSSVLCIQCRQARGGIPLVAISVRACMPAQRIFTDFHFENGGTGIRFLISTSPRGLRETPRPTGAIGDKLGSGMPAANADGPNLQRTNPSVRSKTASAWVGAPRPDPRATRPAGVSLHGTAEVVRARRVVRARCSVPDVWYCVAVRTAALGPSPHRGDTAWLHRSAARLDPRGSRGGVGSVLAAAERRLACTDSGYHAVGTSPANRGRCTAAVVAFAQTTPRYLVRCGRCELRR